MTRRARVRRALAVLLTLGVLAPASLTGCAQSVDPIERLGRKAAQKVPQRKPGEKPSGERGRPGNPGPGPGCGQAGTAPRTDRQERERHPRETSPPKDPGERPSRCPDEDNRTRPQNPAPQ